MGVTTPAVTMGATVLEKAGLLVRRPDANDNRLVRLWPTDDGRALRIPVVRARCQIEEALLRGLGPREVTRFRSILEEVRRAVTDAAASRDRHR